jgi:heme A synthase
VNARQLNAFAVFVAASTFFLIVAGALVTSTGSGLAVRRRKTPICPNP